jgi:tripartite-type tricarboxylate transporter receptor subunit TctC
VKEFIALAKARPGQLRFGSAGSGSGTHLSVELFKSMANIDVLHVPYKGGNQAIIDVISGQTDFMFATAGSALPHVQAQKLRALGVTGSVRSASMHELPTIAEAGVAGYDATTWFGLLGPAAMPRDQDFEPVGNTPDQFAQLIKVELTKWANVVRASKARAD